MLLREVVPNVKVAVVRDAAACFQARCMQCEWRSRWFETGSRKVREEKAVDAAKEHGATQIA